jgi:hypothetical protein
LLRYVVKPALTRKKTRVCRAARLRRLEVKRQRGVLKRER